MTTEEFIRKCTEIHGNVYNYDKAVYVNRYVKVTITCTLCNTTYDIKPLCFYVQRKCKRCMALARKKQQDKVNTGTNEQQNQEHLPHKTSNTGIKKNPPKVKKTSSDVCTHTVKPPPKQQTQPRKKKKKNSTKHSRWRDSSWKKAGEHSKAFHAFAVYVILCYDPDTEEKFIKIGKTFQVVEGRFREFPYKWILLAYWSGSAEQASNAEREMHKLYKEYKYVPQKAFGGQSECFSLDMLNNLDTEKGYT